MTFRVADFFTHSLLSVSDLVTVADLFERAWKENLLGKLSAVALIEFASDLMPRLKYGLAFCFPKNLFLCPF